MSDDATFRALAAFAFLFLLVFGPTQCQRAEIAEQHSADLVKDLERAIKKKDWERVSEIVEDFAISGDNDRGYEVDHHGWHPTE